MRVLLISEEYPFGLRPTFGGGGSHVFYLAFSLAQIGVDIAILAYKDASKEDSPLKNFHNVKVYPCDFGKKEDIFPKEPVAVANQICARWKPDVIHGHHFKGGFVGLGVATSHNLPMILTMHKPPKLSVARYSASSPIYQRSASYSLWHTLATDKRIGAHIAYSKIYAQENYDIGAPKDKVQLIYHGVPVEFLIRKARQLPKSHRLGYDRGDTVVLCPLRPEKHGVDTFIHAACTVKERIGDKFKLLFIVTGDTKSPHYEHRIAAERLLGLARSLKVNIIFRSFSLHQTWKLFHRAQVCVIPSIREGLSISLLESMALGAPVVASDVHGINEVIEDERSGLLAQPSDSNEFAKKIIQILLDKDLSNSLRNNAKKKIAENFSSERMAKEHLNLYKTLVPKKI